ncbi:MAG: HAD-IIIA family hydrolase [Bacteroidota bacterium]
MNTGIDNLAPNLEVRRVLCLDFDGTIRRSKSGSQFIQNADDIELMPGIEKLINRYKSTGYLIFGISNQGGVAHGIKFPAEIEAEMDKTLSLFSKHPFDAIKWCLHMNSGKVFPYNYRSLFRKPDIGMLAEFEEESFRAGFVLDWDNSLFVGDRPEDAQCAQNAGIPFKHIDDFLTEPIVIEI